MQKMQICNILVWNFGTQTSQVHAKYKSLSPYGPTNACPASDKKSNLLGSNVGQGIKK